MRGGESSNTGTTASEQSKTQVRVSIGSSLPIESQNWKYIPCDDRAESQYMAQLLGKADNSEAANACVGADASSMNCYFYVFISTSKDDISDYDSYNKSQYKASFHLGPAGCTSSYREIYPTVLPKIIDEAVKRIKEHPTESFVGSIML